MKAAQISEYGDATKVKLNEVEVPALGQGQVLVEVYASSLNPFDSKLRDGAMKETIPLQFPATLGGDIAGVVKEVGEGVTNVAVGDKIYGQSLIVAGDSGAFAEYTVVSAGKIAKMPETLDFSSAASLPLVGVSALQGLTEFINLTAGQKVLITGGTGGIGSIAIQIAKHLGAYVATTATGDGVEKARSLGADEVVDYTTDGIIDSLKDYDAAFDTVGGDLFDKALRIVKKGGVAVSMIAQPDEQLASDLGVQAYRQGTRVTTDYLDKLRELVDSGVVKPQIAKAYPLSEIVTAFQTRESSQVFGKIVIVIKAAA